MKEKLLTIGIVNYNNHPFIEELIYTISKQVEDNPCIIDEISFFLFDDASDDLAIVELLEKIPKYFIVEQNLVNSRGPSTGRNFIITHTNTKYILFFDGDDSLIGNITQLIEELKGKEADVVISDVVKVLNDGKVDKSPFMHSEKLFNLAIPPKDWYKVVVHQTGIWSIYKRQYLIDNNLLYVYNKRYEDNYFMTNIFLTNPSIDIIKVKYYGWRNNYQSFSYDRKGYFYRKEIFCDILELLSRNKENKWSPWLFYSIWNQTYINIIRNYPILSKREYKEYFDSLEEITHKYKDDINYFLKKIDKNYIDKYTQFVCKNLLNNWNIINFFRQLNLLKKKKITVKSKILQMFFMMPLQKKIFFTSHYGEYNDNSKYLYLSMKNQEKFSDYRFVFAVKEKELYENSADFIDYNNRLLFFFHHYTSKYIYFNSWYSPLIKKRDKQIWTQLWHGIPYKKIYTDVPIYNNMFSFEQKKDKASAIANWDYVWSANKKNTENFHNLFPNVKIIEKEYPKTQWLLDNQANTAIIEKLKKKYKILSKTILYAPTYRPYVVWLDLKKIIDLVNWDIFDKLLIHFHPMMKYKLLNSELLYQNKIEILDQVKDIQEIILCTDALITDYSSIMHDYTQLNKKVIIFAEDVDLYKKICGINEDIFS